jgi:hypothetical protein
VRNPKHRYDHAGVYDVLLIVQDENGCRDSLLKKGHVTILGPRGRFSYTGEDNNCKPVQITFFPSVEQETKYLPDSLAFHTGNGDVIANRGDYYGLSRSRRFVYNNAGAYVPVYFLYKTVNFHGTKETCIVQITEEDTIYVIDLQPNFETEPLYSPDPVNPIIFKNTSTWIPGYLQDSMVSIIWNMGNGDSSQTYYDIAHKDESLNGKTRYATPGIYPVRLTMQVSNCIKEKTVNIVVAQKLFYVFVTANNTSMGSVFGSGDYAKDTTAIIGAIANAGYRFVQWSDGITQNPRAITVTQDSILTAEFAVATQGMFHVSVASNNTTMGSVSGSGDYTANSIAAIGAIANTGYRFVEWNDGNTDNPRAITVTQDAFFIATFEAIIYNVSLTRNDTIRGITHGSGNYIAYSAVTITATPNAGYRFVGWNDNNKDRMRTFSITQNIAFVAIFGIEEMYYIYATPNNPNMGSVTGSNDYGKKSMGDPVFKREYATNSVATIKAIPNNGYRFVQWNDNNTDNPREFTVTGDSIFMAIFESNVGITDVKTSSISVYPNPATDNIHIVLPENVAHAVFTLYDMQGRELIQQKISNRDVIEVGKFASGVYTYHVRTEKENYTGKIIRK